MDPNKDMTEEEKKKQGGDEADQFDESVNQKVAATPPARSADASAGIHSKGSLEAEQEGTSGGASSLEQLQRDVEWKQQSRPATAATTPGAVSVSSSDRDVKGQQHSSSRATQPGVVSVSASNSLEQLERDINAKQAGRGGRSTLQTLEQDIATKRQVGGGVAAKPGAVSVSASASLERLERDVNAKQAASVGRNTLHALEQDIEAKRQAGGNVAAKPGAVAVSASTSLERLERDVSAKQAATVGRNTLQDLEQDIATKRQAGGNVAAKPGVVSVSASTSLEQLERDIDAKRAATTGRSTLQALEQDVATKRQTGGSVAAMPGAIAVTAPMSLEQLEQDLVRKHVAGGDSNQPRSNLEQGMLTQNHKPSGASSMMTDLLVKTQSGDNAHTTGEVKDAPVHSLERASYPNDFGSQSIEVSRISGEQDWKPEISFGDYATEPDHFGVDAPPSPISEDISGPRIRIGAPEPAGGDPDPEQPALATPFFAETVVDATGVAVISGKDEVDEEWERRSIKKLVCYGAVVLVMVVVAAVVPAVLLSNKNHNEAIATDPPTLSPTVAPTGASFPLLLQRLTSITDIEVLKDPVSMQHRAAKWIASADEISLESEVKLLQRYILAVFYFAMSGDSWEQCNSLAACYASEQSWLSETDECDWAAVGCDENGIIEELNFEKAELDYETSFYGPDSVFTLSFRVPDEIGKLSDLKLFHLPKNYKTSGSLSVFSKLTKLESLYLENNAFTGAISELNLGAHPNLTFLNVASNELKGSIPSSLAQISSLTTLAIGGNQLSGQIPSEIGLIPILEVLDLQNSNLSGPIPATLLNGNLHELRLGGNDIEGSIPSSISFMTNLRILSLGDSSMFGMIPTEIFRLPMLSKLDLSNANFEGELSEDFRLLNETLMELRLDGNNFSGDIPLAFDDLQILELLSLENNPLLTGSISTTLCNKRGTGYGRLEELSLDCNIACSCCGDRQCP